MVVIAAVKILYRPGLNVLDQGQRKKEFLLMRIATKPCPLASPQTGGFCSCYCFLPRPRMTVVSMMMPSTIILSQN